MERGKKQKPTAETKEKVTECESVEVRELCIKPAIARTRTGLIVDVLSKIRCSGISVFRREERRREWREVGGIECQKTLSIKNTNTLVKPEKI